MSSTAEQAGAIVGFVLLLNNIPIKFPDVRPFNCSVCLGCWIAAVCGLFGSDLFADWLTRIGLCAVFTFMCIYFMPELYDKVKLKNLEEK